MGEEVLFEITKDKLETGMRGYPVGYCTTSSVDPHKGLSYIERPVAELAGWRPEEVLFLLYCGRQGNAQEVENFTKDLHKRAQCSEETLKQIKLLPRKGDPMKLLSAALLICGMIEGVGEYRQDCLNLIAKIPQIVAAVITHHAGWEMKSSQPKLGYMANFTQMLNPPRANVDELTFVFQLFNILHYDHGGGNLSTFVGKAVASGLEDMYGSTAAAMSALAGPKHGRANQDCLQFVEQILQEVGQNGTEQQIEQLIRKRLEKGELLFGFGHAVLRVEDPRAAVFYSVAKERYKDHPLIKTAHLLREVGPKILKENPKISDPYPNVDAISGAVLTAAGFPYPQYYTVLFGLARVVGISIQIVYERCEARNGKGTPIIRPKYYYKKNS